MKVSINSTFITGPFGGGMIIAALLKNYFIEKGIEVVNNLKDRDIDIILHLNPFPFLRGGSSAYSFFSAYLYKLKHPNTIIINQVNECDERKNTHYMNKLLVMASNYSDYTVFIASWLKPLLDRCGFPKDCPHKVILNGSDETVFNTVDKKLWDGKEKMKIVTHHWGGNYLKGHDIYQKIDKLLDREDFSKKYEFTFIGNYPKNLIYKNTKVISPLSGKELAEELKVHHIYITASRNEPAGLHHIEGALCGLPILYINSGALPEYCQGFGIEFNTDNFEGKLEVMRRDYFQLVSRLRYYDKTGKKMADHYYHLLVKLLREKDRYQFKCKRLNFFLYADVMLYKFFFSGILWIKKLTGIIK